jgi:hypothetical protein
MEEIMITYTLQSKLPKAKADDFYNFMINAPAEIYVNWLPEEHYEFHVVKRSNESPIGDLFYFDQNIGMKYRMKFYAIIKVAENPNRVVFQMRKFGLTLPGYLELGFSDTSEGLHLTETLRIGFNGFGKICDPFIKIVYGKRFFDVFKEHHKREWQCLANIL